MTFDDLLIKLKEITHEELRQHEENYLELVFAKTDLGTVTSELNAYFGGPLKPEGEKPSKEAAQYSAPYGGILQGQTMYYHVKDQGAEAALLWPWGSGMSVTVKVIRE